MGSLRGMDGAVQHYIGRQCKYQFSTKCSRYSLLSLVVEPHHLRLAAYMWQTHVDEYLLVASMTSWKLYFGLVFDDLDVSCILDVTFLA